MTKPFVLATALILGLATPVLAQPTPQSPAPASREEMRQRWQNATPEQRAEMERHRTEMRQRWQNATPEQREQMRTERRGPDPLAGLSPEQRAERQEQLRQRFSQLPLEQQQRLLERRGPGGPGGQGGSMMHRRHGGPGAPAAPVIPQPAQP
jgi:hypothetical protein